jgi:hypothetical protein
MRHKARSTKAMLFRSFPQTLEEFAVAVAAVVVILLIALIFLR